jgi:hypothetical protein
VSTEGSQKQLLTPEEVKKTLSIEDSDLCWLVETGQLSEIVIRGKVRFDSEDVAMLVRTYRRIQRRRVNADRKLPGRGEAV